LNEIFVTPQKAGENKSPEFYLATVAAVSSGRASLTFDGETTATQKYYRHLASYSPTAGHRVLVVKISGTYVILGRVV